MYEFLYLIIIIVLFILEKCAAQMSGHILGGAYTDIKKYPHSVYFHINCAESYICGGSILNQDLALSAAHCFEDCGAGARIELRYGHEYLQSMTTRAVKSFTIHERYEPVTMANDISLVMTKVPMQLASYAKRVAIMKNPPNVETAYVAGWGVVNNQMEVAHTLKFTKQKMQSPRTCRLIGKMPYGSFCAGPIRGEGVPDRGDSGSALVINKYVQIGIVSYKTADYSLVVYTNVSYHYNWIRKTAYISFCRKI